MAKPKAQPSEAQVAFMAAKAAYATAKDAHEKKPDNTAKAKMDAAKTALDAAKLVDNRDRFQRVGGPRMTAALAAIEGIGKLGVTTSYEYTDTDIAKIETTLKDAIGNAVNALRVAKTKTTGNKVAGKNVFRF